MEGNDTEFGDVEQILDAALKAPEGPAMRCFICNELAELGLTVNASSEAPWALKFKRIFETEILTICPTCLIDSILRKTQV